MARLIARDATVSIAFGGFDDGSAPTWSTDTAIEGKAREVSIDQNGPTVNLAGLSDVMGRVRFGGGATQTLRITGFLTGESFEYFLAGNSPIGQRVRVKVKPKSTLEAAHEFKGVCTRWRWSTQAGQEQVEEIEVEGPLDA